MTTMEQVSALIIDDHRSFADAMALAMRVTGIATEITVASTSAGGLAQAARHRPALAIVDFVLPDLDGIETIRRLAHDVPGVRTILLTGRADRSIRSAALSAGAGEVLAKESDVQSILDVVRGVMAGSHRPSDGEATGDCFGLTARESQVLLLLAQGLDLPTISSRLYLSPHTAKGYLKELMAKLGAHTQLQAVLIAMRHGLVPGPTPATL